jgi:hypothetical protein
VAKKLDFRISRYVCGGGCTLASTLALARGGAGGALFFMIKQYIYNIRKKMKYNNL